MSDNESGEPNEAATTLSCELDEMVPLRTSQQDRDAMERVKQNLGTSNRSAAIRRSISIVDKLLKIEDGIIAREPVKITVGDKEYLLVLAG